jgi:hypothetical protein
MIIVDQIKSIIKNNFNTSDLSIEFITKDSLKKNSKILNSSEYPGFNYLSILYQNEYHLNNYQEQQLSINLFHNKKLVGFWFLALISKNNNQELISIEDDIKEPLFINNIESKIKIKIISIAINVLQEILNANLVKKIICSEIPFIEKNKDISIWHKNLILNKFLPKVRYRYYVDLKDDIDKIYSNFSSTRKNLFNKDLTNNYKLIILDHKNFVPEIYDKFRSLHFLKSKKKTRSDKTWEIQKEMIKEGRAFFTGYQLDENLTAGTFIYFSKKIAIYSVAVFDHNNDYLSTKIMYENFLYLKNNNVDLFILNNFNLLETDPKILNINFFISQITNNISSYFTFEKVN